MGGKGTEKAERRFIVLIQDCKNVQGQKFPEGTVMEISAVNCHRPSEKHLSIHGLNPLYFDYLTEEESRDVAMDQDEGIAVAVLGADDPLAGIGL